MSDAAAGRNLYTAYRQEIQLLPTWTQKAVFGGVILALLFLLPFDLPVISHIPVIRFLGDPEWLRPMALTAGATRSRRWA